MALTQDDVSQIGKVMIDALEPVYKQLDKVDSRLDKVDLRLERVEQKVDALTAEVDDLQKNVGVLKDQSVDIRIIKHHLGLSTS